MKNTQNPFSGECTETLMLAVLFGRQELRQEALEELKLRRENDSLHALPDDFMTNIGTLFCAMDF